MDYGLEIRIKLIGMVINYFQAYLILINFFVDSVLVHAKVYDVK